MVIKTAGGEVYKSDNSVAQVELLYDMPPMQVGGRDGRVRPWTLMCCVLLVSSLVLASLFVGGFLFLFQAEKALHYKTELKFDNGRASSSQETTSFNKDNIVQQRVVDGQREMVQITDFNRDIIVMKVKDSSQSASEVCYISPLNRSAVTIHPDSIPAQPTVIETAKADVKLSILYTPFDHSILDVSILGPKGQQLCSGLSVYWALPAYAQQAVTSSTRHKREVDYFDDMEYRGKRQGANPGTDPGIYYNTGCSTLQCKDVKYAGNPNTFMDCTRVYYPCPPASGTSGK